MNHTPRLFRKATVWLFLSAVLASTPLAASALPGQSLAAVEKWAAHNRALGVLQPGPEGQMTVRIKVPYSDRLVFNVNLAGPRASIDQSEVIVYWHPAAAGGIEFGQSGSTGLRLLKTIYGAAIAGDYAKAKFAGTVNGHQRYVGRKFAYEISSDTSSPPRVYQYLVVRPK